LPDRPTLTLSEIAELAGGVTVPAVANWRNRFKDFPQPVGKAGKQILFDRDEVLEWLERRGKSGDVRDRNSSPIHQVAELFRGHGLDSEDVFKLVLGRPVPGFDEDVVAGLERQIQTAVQQFGETEVLEAFLQALPRSVGRKFAEYETSPSLEALYRALSETAEDAVIYDPCIGLGSAARAISTSSSRVFGQDIDPDVAEFAERLLISSVKSVEIRVGDVLAVESHPDVIADRVIAVPPLRPTNAEIDPGDPRWAIEVPKGLDGFPAFAQVALAHLSEEGRAILHLPASVLDEYRSRAFREQLVRQNLLEAVIVLPPLAGLTRESCILILDKSRPKSSLTTHVPVMLLDAPGPVRLRSKGLSRQDLEYFVSAWGDWRRGEAAKEGVVSVALPDFAANDFVFTPSRYRKMPPWPRPFFEDDSGEGHPAIQELRDIEAGIHEAKMQLDPAYPIPVGLSSVHRIVSLEDLVQAGSLKLVRGSVQHGMERHRDVIEVSDLNALKHGASLPTPQGEFLNLPDPDASEILLGDILIGIRPKQQEESPQVCAAPLEWVGRSAGSSVAILRCTGTGAIPLVSDYLLFWLRTQLFSHHYRSRLAGSTMPRIGRKDLLSFEIPLADFASQQALAEHLRICAEADLAAHLEAERILEKVQQRAHLLAEYVVTLLQRGDDRR
jgi:hypothetical protein